MNVQETTVLCIKTDIEVQEGLALAGLNVPPTAKHLGLYLAPTIEDTVNNPLQSSVYLWHPDPLTHIIE